MDLIKAKQYTLLYVFMIIQGTKNVHLWSTFIPISLVSEISINVDKPCDI